MMIPSHIKSFFIFGSLQVFFISLNITLFAIKNVFLIKALNCFYYNENEINVFVHIFLVINLYYIMKIDPSSNISV